MDSLGFQLTEQVWDNLKIPVTIIAVLAPVMIVFLVVRYKRIIKRLKEKHETNKKIVEKRIEVYDRIGPKLNDILCFYCYTGDWKKLAPPDILELKRELDKEINISTPLFSDDLHAKYDSFIRLCFVAHSGWEHDEKIKSRFELRQENCPEWKDEWITFFDTNNVVEATTLKERYDELLEYFKMEMSP